jgi:hypothetical protein
VARRKVKQSVVTCLQPQPIYTQFWPALMNSPHLMKHTYIYIVEEIYQQPICTSSVYQSSISSIFSTISSFSAIYVTSRICMLIFLSRQLIKPRGETKILLSFICIAIRMYTGSPIFSRTTNMVI